MEPIDVKSQPSAREIKAFEGFNTIIVDAAKQMFMQDKVLESAIFIGQDMPDGKIAYICLPAQEFMKTAESKDDLSELMTTVCKSEPLCICLVTECWMVRHDTKNKSKEEISKIIHEIIPSQHPDRIEGLLLTFESENMQEVIFYEIIRKGSEVSLKLTTDVEGATHLKGRFAGMLKDMKKMKWN